MKNAFLIPTCLSTNTKCILWKLNSSFNQPIGLFHDQLYGKKWMMLKTFGNNGIFLFFKMLTFSGIFGIRAWWRFLCQKYIKKTKFWKKNSSSQNLKIKLFYLIYVDRRLSTSILQPFSSRPNPLSGYIFMFLHLGSNSRTVPSM